MGSMDQVDEMTFKINFSSEGLEKLREKVNHKLKEFMGDYTDDTLVDYVIVLLRNGRRKDEARNELNVFLGDDSDPFISWLWDDLAANLNLYAQPQESVIKESDSDQGKSNKLTKRRRNSEWNGPIRNGADPPPLLSSEILDNQVKEKTRHKPKHARKARRSPTGSSLNKRRLFGDDQQHVNRETISQATANAPRRLLQFAVRDAVGSLRSPNSVAEPSTKRLRSVVSTSTSYSPVVERPCRIKSVASVPNSMATVIKAVADAAEDVRNAKFSRNVFDRLGPDNMDFEEIADSGRVEHMGYNQIEEEIQPAYIERSNYSGADMTMLETETQQPYDFISDKSYDYAGDIDSRVMNAPQTYTSGGNRDDSYMRPQIIKHPDDIIQDQPVVLANKPRNTRNSSVHVAAAIRKSGVPLMKDHSSDVPVGNGNAKLVPNVQKGSQKMLQSGSGTNTTGPPSEDADSRTIFVSNVHFGATKDLLSRHFNKLGEVLRVVIVTDAATGQPKGCAYVEFMQKEAADNALSFDGTSFMSRIVKVVKKSGVAAHEEAAPPPPPVVAAWPRVVARAYGGGGGRFPRAGFPRGAFRGRGLPRSLQWKRGATTEGTVPSPTARSLTYVRTTEPKPSA